MQIDQENLKAINEERKKATFSLCKASLDNLETMWIEARKMFDNKKISRSLILELSIYMVMDDFEKLKEKSQLYGLLVWMIDGDIELNNTIKE